MRIGTIVLFVLLGMVLFSFLILIINGLRLGYSLNMLIRKVDMLIRRAEHSE